MHNGGLFDNEAITVQTGNIPTRVGQGNFINFIGIQPNLAFAALEHGRRQAFLKLQRHCVNESEENECEKYVNKKMVYRWFV